MGESLSGLTDAIRRLGKIAWIHVRHEAVAVFAAAADASDQLSPSAPAVAAPAICTSTSASLGVPAAGEATPDASQILHHEVHLTILH